jgi:2-polyprenyl-6-hydroxyphenyl methylase/3-demethylubiquinone-9 3-methyltransferase
MRACTRLTGDNGVMFVATINRTALAWLFAIVGAEYVLRWLPKGTHRWSEFRTPSEIEALLEKGGLSACRRSGVSVNPLNHAFSLTRRMSVNYMIMAAREHQSPR